ncbi:MAG: hypothetical protein ACE5JS_13290 [Nitrospinota bacterium]
MKCEEFKTWLEERGPSGPPASAGEMPEELAEHGQSCPGCRSLLREELFWKRFFAAGAEAPLTKSLWPGVLAKIEAQTRRSESFSAAILLLGRRLVPAFALFLLLLGGAAFWQGSVFEPQDAGFALEGLVEPDAVLNQWAGVTD